MKPSDYVLEGWCNGFKEGCQAGSSEAQAQGDGSVHQGILPGRGLHVLDDGLGMGLAPLHERQSLQRSIVELRGHPSHASRLQIWLRHWAPPAGEAGGAGR